MKLLIKIKSYRHLLLIGFLIYLAGKFAEVFTPYFILDSGGGVMQQAIYASVSGAFDLPFFWLSPYLLRRFKLKHLMTAAAVAALFRTGIIVLATSAQSAIFTAFFATAQYAIFHPTMRYYVSKVAPEHLRVSAQALITIVSYNASNIFASLFGGKLISLFGVKCAFSCASGVVVVAIVLLVSGVVLKDVKNEKVPAES